MNWMVTMNWTVIQQAIVERNSARCWAKYFKSRFDKATIENEMLRAENEDLRMILEEANHNIDLLQQYLTDVVRRTEELKGQLSDTRSKLYIMQMASTDTISDGFGSVWNKYCEYCGAPMTIVRPGYAKCSEECFQ